MMMIMMMMIQDIFIIIIISKSQRTKNSVLTRGRNVGDDDIYDDDIDVNDNGNVDLENFHQNQPVETRRDWQRCGEQQTAWMEFFRIFEKFKNILCTQNIANLKYIVQNTSNNLIE